MLFAVLGLTLLGWGVLAGMRAEKRLIAWYVRCCGGDGRRALGLCVTVFVGFGLLTVLGGLAWHAVTEAADSRVAGAWVYLPITVVCWPVAMALLPTRSGWHLPGDLRRAGAPRGVVRSSYVLLPVGLVALVVFGGGFVATFAPD